MSEIYDVAIIGAGPAGISAAINFKLHNKNMIWFGSREMSDKVHRSSKIANFPGMGLISGDELNARFLAHVDELGIELTDKMVTNIMKSGEKFMILAENDMYTAKSVLLATGAVQARGFEGEAELLGRGVSYCATCDGFFYKGRTIAVFCGAPRYEHEVKYLAEIAEKVYLYTPYGAEACELDKLENVERLGSPIKAIRGEGKVSAIELVDGTAVDIDGIFILRTAVAPTAILSGLEMDGPHIRVDAKQETNIKGCYAAGDCTGRPYQISVAVGEGNVAAHEILEAL